MNQNEYILPKRHVLPYTQCKGGGREIKIMDYEKYDCMLTEFGYVAKLPCGGKRIRKLTERECFRLMGVKDEDFDRAQKRQSMSSMYHMAGDSIVTACLMAIFGEMLDVDWKEKILELQKNLTEEKQ